MWRRRQEGASASSSVRRYANTSRATASSSDGPLCARVAAEVLTLEEAAAFLRVEAIAVEESARRGELPGRRLGGEWRFSRDALLAWLEGSSEPRAE
jgi:excisionase family DNA binding protein